MNTQTGQIYRGEGQIGDARARGEEIVEVSSQVAALVERGALEMNKDELRRQWRERWFGVKEPVVSAPAHE